MKHEAPSVFWRHFEALPAEVQELARKNFALLRVNPMHASLHFKQLRPGLWSARVGQHYRALAVPIKEGFRWFWIGSHAEYDQLIKGR